MLKKILKITGITLVALIGILLLVPLLFKSHITNLVKKEINKSVNAKVDFQDVRLSLFRHFPRISITMDDLVVIGVNEFANDTLIAVSSADATVNLFSVIKGNDIKVSRIYLESPRIDLKINEDGVANWDIAKVDGSSAVTDTSASEFQMTLKYYKIENAHIRYNDQSTGMRAEFAGVDHEGSGDFTKDVFTLRTQTQTNAVSFVYGNIPYLLHTKTGIEADIMIDNTNNKYSFKTDDILLNSLKLSSEGFFQILNDSTYFMDIRFNSPSNEFKDILSMIPAVYSKDFEKLQASGHAVFKGFVKGIYSPQQMPAYDIDLQVKDGNFHYPDLPKQVKNVQMSMHVNNPDGKYDNTIVDISRAQFQIDNEPVDLRLIFKQPETMQYVDASVKGKIDLSGITQFMKLEKGTRLSGVINADAFIKGSLSAIQNQGPFIAGGFFDVKNVSFSSKDFPQPLHHLNMKVKIENASQTPDGTIISVEPAHFELGKDHFDLTMQITNPFSTMDIAGKLKSKMTLENLRQFMDMDRGSTLSGTVKSSFEFAGNKAAFDKKNYEKIRMNGSVQLNNIKYVAADYPEGIVITTAHMELEDHDVTLTGLSGSYLNTNFRINGSLTDVSAYLMNKGVLKGNITMSADKLDLNQWMGTGSQASTTSSAPIAPFIVPSDLDITVNAKAAEIEYDKVDYRNVSGTLLMKDETVSLQNMKMNAVGGTMIVAGSYSTLRNKTQPDILINYDIKEIDVQRTFTAFNTVRTLMPIGQFLSGKLSSQLNMTGNLDKAMMPDLNTLTGAGNILLIEGVLKKYAPLEKIAETLEIDELKDITIKDIKNSIEFANGKVLVKPFNVKVKNIDMQIGGTHGLDRNMNYIVAMKVPKKYIGTDGNNIIDGLVTQANSRGLPVKAGEIVNLHIKVSGSMTNPSIQVDLQEVAGDAVAGLKQQATDFAKDKYTATKQSVLDTARSTGKEITGTLKNELKEEFNKQFFGKDTTTTAKTDSVKTKPADKLKSKLEAMLPRNKKPKG